MKGTSILTGTLWALLLGAAAAQAPVSEVDAHVAAARAAAGQDYRATFVNPFIVGADGVQRYFTVMAECALASKLRVGAK